MTTISAASPDYQRDLGDGLLLRWSTAEDTERIAQLEGSVFRRSEDGPPNEYMANLTYQLMHGTHPFMGPGDFALIEDTSREGHPVVAATCLWRQRWEYEGIPFSVGQPEYVACEPDYRNRGLIRALFELIHARSEAEGHMVQGITGIAYFYRQFGYEYAVDLGGGRSTYLPLIPSLKEGTSEPYTLREATVEDIAQIRQYYRNSSHRGIVWADASARYWRYWILDWRYDPANIQSIRPLMIVDAQGKTQGYVSLIGRRWNRVLNVHSLGISSDVQWRHVLPSLLRSLRDYGTQVPPSRPDLEPFSEIRFSLGREHPIYDVLGEALLPSYQRPYAWYVRVPQLPAFLLHIAAAFERRLSQSLMAGYTGELNIDCYRYGLRLAFEQGRLTAVEPWQVPHFGDHAHMGCPPLVLLQLVFGHRSLDALRDAFPDVWVSDSSELLVNTLFPTRPSYPLDL
jgi:GNAT superfamily N-acetyltransferase